MNKLCRICAGGDITIVIIEYLKETMMCIQLLYLVRCGSRRWLGTKVIKCELR